MITLLQHYQYSLTDIFILAVFLALAIKSLVSFFDWGQTRFDKIFKRKHARYSEKEKLKRRLEHGSEIMSRLQKNQQTTDNLLQTLTHQINMLIESDKDDIKSYITKEHHYFCYELGWIDDFSLNCLQNRFKHYTDEGGNSFIERFMNQLRALPKQPLEIIEKE